MAALILNASRYISKYKTFVTVLIYWELGDENMEMCKRAHIFKFGQVNL